MRTRVMRDTETAFASARQTLAQARLFAPTSPHRVFRAEFQWSMVAGGCADLITSGPAGSIRIVVADRGSGMERTERPTGFGSRLSRLLIAQVKGDIGFQDNGPGTKVVLTAALPAATEGHAATGALPSSS